jgi:hypothetical protein
MATDNKKITVSELDFDTIKANLKTFLQGQSEFQDYDFEGSGMSVLLDVLAYNTHYNGVYTNMALNEMFLDSARKRNSVVSLAKMLSYTPTSAKASTAVVNVTVTNPARINGDLPRSLTLPAKSGFTTMVEGRPYTFYNLSSQTIIPINNEYIFKDVSIVEGTPLTFNYNFSVGGRYIIPNANVDTSLLTIRVQEPVGYVKYVYANNITEITSDTRAYFLKEIDDELFEIYFGDGVVGYKPPIGSIVLIDYIVTNREAPNKASQFTYSGDQTFGGVVTVQTIAAADGGQSIEDIDSIKFNAPHNYSAQNRAVTAEDYKVILSNLYPNIDSIAVWGGEDNIPPRYGRVYIGIKPKSGETLTPTTKLYIETELLKSRNIVSIIPEIVDPIYLYLDINTTIYYDPTKTTYGADTLIALVKQAILDYNDTDLTKFDGIFRFSKLSRLIDSTEGSILSNITTVNLRRKIIPVYGETTQYIVRIDNPIYTAGVPEDAVISTGFYLTSSPYIYYFVDDGVGNLRLFHYFANAFNRNYVNNNIGTVDYSKGIITISDINIDRTVDGEDLQFRIIPQSNDVVSVRTQLVTVDQSTVSVNAIVDKISAGNSSGSTNYIFTPSR